MTPKNSPTCSEVSETIECICKDWGDALGSEARDRLLHSVQGSVTGTGPLAPEQEATLQWSVLDWMTRVWTAQWLELVPELHGCAHALRALPPTSATTFDAAARTLSHIQRDTWNARSTSSRLAAHRAVLNAIGAQPWDMVWIETWKSLGAVGSLVAGTACSKSITRLDVKGVKDAIGGISGGAGRVAFFRDRSCFERLIPNLQGDTVGLLMSLCAQAKSLRGIHKLSSSS